MRLLRSLIALLRRNRLDVEMSVEMRAHLDEQAQRNVDAGMSRDDASAAAHRQFGGVTQLQERCRDQRGWRRFENFGRDLQLAVRMAQRAPGFSAIVLVTLACGIGATTAVFSGVNALPLRPLPVRDPAQLVVLAAAGPGVGTREFGVRMALGAGRHDIWRLVFLSGGRLILIGLILGLAASIGLAQVVQSRVFAVPLLDPTALAGAAMLLSAVAVLATWLPARRATKVDPLVALRAE